MRLGIGLGLFKAGLISAGVRIFSAFQTRVIGDGGTVEAGTCVVNGINGSALLQQASLLLIPSGYKGGKLYAQIPTNGNGDLTWTRGGTANRTNASGNIELMGANVPRLSYMYGSCPAVLLEPQRTNSIRNSTMVGAVTGTPGTLPTNWAQGGGGGSSTTRTIVGVGVENGLTYIDIRYQGSTAGQYRLITESGAIASAVVGSIYTNSIYLKLISGTAPQFKLVISNRDSTNSFLSDNSGALFSLNSTLTRYTYTVTIAQVGTAFAQPLIETSFPSSYDFTIRIAQPQMEQGAYETTAILTTGSATATRVADSFSRSNIYTNGWISASGGTWFVEFKNTIPYIRDTFAQSLFIGGNSTGVGGDGFAFTFGGSTANRPLIRKYVGAVESLVGTLTSDNSKVAIKWNGSTADVFINGTKVTSATSFAFTNLQFVGGVGSAAPVFIQQMALHPEPLTDAKLIELTTL